MGKKKAKKGGFQLFDTSVIQAESLRLFMASLGYVPWRGNGGWITDNPALAANRVISTRTAIKLHNTKPQDWVSVAQGWFRPGNVNVDIALTRASLRVSFASKLVEQVKFTPDKHASYGIRMPVDPLAHLIKAVDPQFLVDWSIAGA